MATVITFGNFKGGTGKTSSSTLIAYTLSTLGYRVLLADLDPQANATTLYIRTKQRSENDVITVNNTLMTAIANNNLADVIMEIKDNLFLLPSFADFTSYPLFLEKKFPDSQKERSFYFSKLLEPIKSDYDFILIDVPPTLSTYTDSALLASNYTIIVLQTQERSLIGASAYIKYLQELIDNYGANLDILGVLPVLLKNNAPVDLSTLESAKEEFGDNNLFKTVIKNMERIKRYDLTGIVGMDDEKSDIHDIRLHTLYIDVTKELLKRLDEMEDAQ